MPMTFLRAVFVGLVGIVATLTLEQQMHREAIFRAAAQDPARAAQLLAASQPKAAWTNCSGESMSSDGAAVLSALMIIEQFASSSAELKIEELVLRAATFLGLKPPDFSYGPMQIRFSSMRQTLAMNPIDVLELCNARFIARLLIAKN